MVTVPEGHRVAVVQLAQQPTFGRMESGFHVGDTGPHAGSDQVISAVAQYIAATPQAQVLLVIQPSALARELADPPTMAVWLQRLSALFAPDRPLPIMVVPQAQPGGATLACLIQSLGVCVYDSAQDGAVFVEIHTPNGMRTGLPGTLLSNDSEPTLGTIYMARRAAATSDAAAEVRDLTIRGLSVITEIMACFAPRSPAALEQLSLAMLVTLAANVPSDIHLNAFYRVLLQSTIGTQVSPEQYERAMKQASLKTDQDGRQTRSVTTNKDLQIRIPLVTLKDGTPMLLFYCDIPAMVEVFQDPHFLEQPAIEVLAMAQTQGFGVIVQNRLDGLESALCILPAQVSRLLNNAPLAPSPPPTLPDRSQPWRAPAETQQQRLARGDAERGRERQHYDFSVRLLAALLERTPRQNLFISPLSITIALASLANGAGGSTRDAIMATLGMPGAQADALNQACAELWKRLEQLDPQAYEDRMLGFTDVRPNVYAAIANGIWLNDSVPFNAACIETMRNAYKTEVGSIATDQAEAVAAINRWVSEHTDGNVTTIIERVTANTSMVLANATYFKGAWASPFEPSNTEEAPFTLADGTTIPCDMMYHEDSFLYADDDTVQLVALPFFSGDARSQRGASMVVVLPRPGHSLDEALATLSPEWRMQAMMQNRWFMNDDVHLWLPRFEIACSTDLQEVLSSMGMGVAFDPAQADFTGLTAMRPTWLSEAVHATSLLVNEQGAVAAAATRLTVATFGTHETLEVRVDRPFICAIILLPDWMPLFVGAIHHPTRVAAPAPPEAAPRPIAPPPPVESKQQRLAKIDSE